MRRIMSVVAALGLTLAACGSGDEPASDATAGPSAESAETSEESVGASDEMTDETTDDGEDSPADDATSDEMTDDGDGADDGEGAAADGDQIRTLNDVPAKCRDEMARFLRAIEPIVSPIDWKAASLSDFESIAEQFEEQSDNFTDSSAVAGCSNLNFVDDNSNELLIEFARDEAPDAIEFLEFLDVLQSAGASGGGNGDGGSAGGQLETCADAIAFLQGLIADYDIITDVPAADLLKFSQLPTLYATCTPDQLAFFDSDEAAAFLDG